MSALNEFEQIARLFRPLTRGAPEALDLLDDAAVLAARPGFDLVITKDAMVAGVHFLASDPFDLVARKLLRANLSDLAAKAAEPFGYFLIVIASGGKLFRLCAHRRHVFCRCAFLLCLGFWFSFRLWFIIHVIVLHLF